MKKKLVAAGVLTGGIALTALAGSASAAGGTPTARPAGPVTGRATAAAPGVAVACVGEGPRVKGRPEKGVVSIKGDGKLPPHPAGAPDLRVRSGAGALPAPPAGGKGAVTITTKKDAHGTVKFGPLPKGVHCFQVKPGTPGAPPPKPAR